MRNVLIAGITAILLLPLLACRTEEARYRTLSFFFDGVPPLTMDLPQNYTMEETQQRVAIQFTLHEPWAERKCELCHDQMFSNKLRMEKSELCATCHEGVIVERGVMHGPVAFGECDVCHNPHRARFANLLNTEGDALCTMCHDDEMISDVEVHQVDTGKSCLDCHDPHSSDNAYLIR